MFTTGTPNPPCSELKTNWGIRRVFIGEMTERPKVHDWKSCVPGRVPRVQIPLSPDYFSKSEKSLLNQEKIRKAVGEGFEGFL